MRHGSEGIAVSRIEPRRGVSAKPVTSSIVNAPGRTKRTRPRHALARPARANAARCRSRSFSRSWGCRAAAQIAEGCCGGAMAGRRLLRSLVVVVVGSILPLPLKLPLKLKLTRPRYPITALRIRSLAVWIVPACSSPSRSLRAGFAGARGALSRAPKASQSRRCSIGFCRCCGS
jgi:hypothetical protein